MIKRSKSVTKPRTYCKRNRSNPRARKIKKTYIRLDLEPSTFLPLARLVDGLSLLDDNTLLIRIECLIQTINDMFAASHFGPLTEFENARLLIDQRSEQTNPLRIRFVRQTFTVQIDNVIGAKAWPVYGIIPTKISCRNILSWNREVEFGS